MKASDAKKITESVLISNARQVRGEEIAMLEDEIKRAAESGSYFIEIGDDPPAEVKTYFRLMGYTCDILNPPPLDEYIIMWRNPED